MFLKFRAQFAGSVNGIHKFAVSLGESAYGDFVLKPTTIFRITSSTEFRRNETDPLFVGDTVEIVCVSTSLEFFAQYATTLTTIYDIKEVMSVTFVPAC